MPGLRPFAYLAQYLDVAVAITERLLEVSLRTNVRSVRVSAIDDFGLVIHSEPCLPRCLSPQFLSFNRKHLGVL